MLLCVDWHADDTDSLSRKRGFIRILFFLFVKNEVTTILSS